MLRCAFHTNAAVRARPPDAGGFVDSGLKAGDLLLMSMFCWHHADGPLPGCPEPRIAIYSARSSPPTLPAHPPVSRSYCAPLRSPVLSRSLTAGRCCWRADKYRARTAPPACGPGLVSTAAHNALAKIGHGSLLPHHHPLAPAAEAIVTTRLLVSD